MARAVALKVNTTLSNFSMFISVFKRNGRMVWTKYCKTSEVIASCVVQVLRDLFNDHDFKIRFARDNAKNAVNKRIWYSNKSQSPLCCIDNWRIVIWGI